MMITAKIVADSENEFGNQLTSMVVTFPRFILAELNTHRMFSRNSASSRAIPFGKMLESVKKNPFIPIAWQKDHSGMQGTEYVTDPSEIKRLNDLHLIGRDQAMEQAQFVYANGVTKQLCNRYLEPYMNHTILITATEWENFFALRCPFYRVVGRDNDPYDPEFDYRSKKDLENKLGVPDVVAKARKEGTDEYLAWATLNKGQAEIHMMALAEAMWDALGESTPVKLKAGEYHIPFSDSIDDIQLCDTIEKVYGIKPLDITRYSKAFEEVRIKIATARCARVSYTIVGEEGKEPNYENDIKLHDRLVKSGHMSPTEHCARAMSAEEYVRHGIISPLKEEDKIVGDIRNCNMQEGWSGNFRGFIQYRKMIPNENITVK
jgi:thymidylate synthase ThyX